MWPFKKKPPEPPGSRKPTHFGVTSLQAGDDCVCVDDDPHYTTHQKLLDKGQTYKVRAVFCASEVGPESAGYGGPWIRVDGIVPTGDSAWLCRRFEKAAKPPPTAILRQVMEPTDLDVETAKEEAY